MIVRKYGIELHRLTEDDIELVRKYRNSEAIRSKMFYQKTISEEEQKKWFASINNDWNYYFLIIHKGLKVGLVHGKIDSYETRTAQGGLFIWDETTLDSPVPVIASVCATDLTFFVMEMKVTTAEVRLDNQRAIQYNLSMGYDITQELPEEGKVLMELRRDNYLLRADKIRKTVKKLGKDSSDLSWKDLDMSTIKYPHLYQNLPQYLADKLKFNTANE